MLLQKGKFSAGKEHFLEIIKVYCIFYDSRKTALCSIFLGFYVTYATLPIKLFKLVQLFLNLFQYIWNSPNIAELVKNWLKFFKPCYPTAMNWKAILSLIEFKNWDYKHWFVHRGRTTCSKACAQITFLSTK